MAFHSKPGLARFGRWKWAWWRPAEVAQHPAVESVEHYSPRETVAVGWDPRGIGATQFSPSGALPAHHEQTAAIARPDGARTVTTSHWPIGDSD